VPVKAIAGALGLRRIGTAWRGPCPLCGGHKRFQLREGRSGPLVYCWGGCSGRDLLAELRRRGLLPERERREFSEAEKAEWKRAQQQAAKVAQAAARWWRERIGELDDAAGAAIDLERDHLNVPALSYAASEAWKLRQADAAGVIQHFRRAIETDREHTAELVAAGARWEQVCTKLCKLLIAALARRQNGGKGVATTG
jgi:hypothetical protein